jgi:hypothetical protein
MSTEKTIAQAGSNTNNGHVSCVNTEPKDASNGERVNQSGFQLSIAVNVTNTEEARNEIIIKQTLSEYREESLSKISK